MSVDIQMSHMSQRGEEAGGRLNPHDDLLPSDPNSSIMGHLVDSADKENGVSTEEIDSYLKTIKVPKLVLRRILELTIVPLLFLLPASFIQNVENFPQYDFSQVKGPQGLHPYGEFCRWSIFLALAYASLTLSDLVVGQASPMLCWIFKSLKFRMTRDRFVTLQSFQKASGYIGVALGMIMIHLLALQMLYEPSIELATRQLLAGLSQAEQLDAQQLMFGQNCEMYLAAAFILVLFITAEKFIMAAIRSNFYENAFAKRIARCNDKLSALSTLYQAKYVNQTTPSATSYPGKLDNAGEAEIVLSALDGRMRPDHVPRAKAIASGIFKSLCPTDRLFITSGDFRGFFPPGQHEKSFQLFDNDRKGQLDQTDFENSVLELYGERAGTVNALIESNGIVRKLDNVLFGIFALFGTLLAFVALHATGYAWVTSAGSLILGLGFLLESTFSRIFDAFLFVFVEHAYDIGDTVLIDNETLTVKKLEIFTTIFLKGDGTLIYFPNPSLKGKAILNKQRSCLESDTLVLLTDAATEMGKIARLRSKVSEYLAERIDEFTGTVTANVLSFDGSDAGRRARVRLECKYRPSGDGCQPESALSQRRAALVEYVMALSKELDLAATIEFADK